MMDADKDNNISSMKKCSPPASAPPPQLPPPTTQQPSPPSSHPSASAAAAVCKLTSKNGRQPIACKICKRPSFYFYYTVRCCEGCKQFFRRIVVNKREYWCRRDGQCSMRNDTLSTGERCLGCRLDRCLLVGMQPRMVNAIPGDEEWRKFMERLENRRKTVQKKHAAMLSASAEDKRKEMEAEEGMEMEYECEDGMPMLQHQEQQQGQPEATAAGTVGGGGVQLPVVANAKDWQQLNMLLMIESRQRTIWDQLTEMPAWIGRQFQSVVELIQFGGNIILTAQPKGANRMTRQCKREKADVGKYPNDTDVINFICIDTLLLLEWERALPVFTELDINDQLILLINIYVPFMALCNAFYGKTPTPTTTAPDAGTGAWTRGISGYLFQEEMQLTDQRLKFLCEKVFCKTVVAVNALGICQEEFVLLLAILCCNSKTYSAAAQLSAAGRERLYDQSTRYCATLLRFLQHRLGPEAGVRKYADCLHLLELLFSLRCTFELFTAYWAKSSAPAKAKQQEIVDELRPDSSKPAELFPKALSLLFPFLL